MSISHASNANQLLACPPFPRCSWDVANNLEGTTRTLNNYRKDFNTSNTEFFFYLQNKTGSFSLDNNDYSSFAKARLCSLRATLFPGEVFADPIVSDRCKQKRMKDVKEFFVEYFSLMEDVHSFYMNHSKPDRKLFMDLFFQKQPEGISEAKALNWEIQIASEQNDKEAFYKSWKECQSYLKENQTYYEERHNRLIFWSSFIGFVYMLVVSCIGYICCRRKPRIVDTSDSLEEGSLDKENLTIEADSDNQSTMSQQNEN